MVKEKGNETYYIGIDLGTSRTSIATSTGIRMTQRTCVGYPKDLISKKRFKQNYLLGEEAINNRLALDLVFPLADGVVREGDPRAVESTALLLKHLFAEAIPSKQKTDKIYAAIGVPSEASDLNQKMIIELSKGFIDKLLIISEPFAIAYALDRFDEVLVVDFGAGTVDLCLVTGAFPSREDQISLKTAGNYLDNLLGEKISQKFPKVQITKEIVRKIKEKYGYVDDSSEEILVKLTEAGILKEYNLTSVLKESCNEFVQPIIKSIQTLIGNFDPEFQGRLRNNIILSGGGSRLRGLDKLIEKNLEPYGGANVVVVQDVEYMGAVGCLKMALEYPENLWENI